MLVKFSPLDIRFTDSDGQIVGDPEKARAEFLENLLLAYGESQKQLTSDFIGVPSLDESQMHRIWTEANERAVLVGFAPTGHSIDDPIAWCHAMEQKIVEWPIGQSYPSRTKIVVSKAIALTPTKASIELYRGGTQIAGPYVIDLIQCLPEKAS